MARYRKKKALYEVMGKGRVKPGKTVEPLRRPEAVQHRSVESQPVKPAEPAPSKSTPWPTKPPILQFNAGRVEISVPYQIMVVVILGIALLGLVIFRLGQVSGDLLPAGPAEIGKKVPADPIGGGGTATPDNVGKVEADTTTSLDNGSVVKVKGDHVIVLVEYGAKADLEPVQMYFAGFSIETEIVLRNGRYFLQTTERFENPKKAGTDGNLALQEIIGLGAGYKAPPGYESFAKHRFSDAYGKKMK